MVHRKITPRVLAQHHCNPPPSETHPREKDIEKDALVEKYSIASPLVDQPTLQSWVMKSGQHKNLVFMRAPSGNGKLMEME
jgi:hypothetical protein